MTSHGEQGPSGAGPVTVHGYFVPLREPGERAVDLASVKMFSRRRRALLLGGAAIGFVVAFAYAALSPPRYRASALVTAADGSNGEGLTLPGQLGSLASLAGVTLPNASARAEHIAFLRSQALAEEFIRTPGVAELLGADETAPPRGARPSRARAIRTFTERVCSVREDHSTGLITVTIRWRDPVVAAEWANALVALANERSRQRAISESTRTIDFLARELEKTGNIELQRAIHRLMQSQLQIAALASVRSEYALHVIDPARPPEPGDYGWPRHAVLLPFGLVSGTLAAAFVALLAESVGLVRTGERARSASKSGANDDGLAK